MFSSTSLRLVACVLCVASVAAYNFEWEGQESPELKTAWKTMLDSNVENNIAYHNREHGTDFSEGVRVMSPGIAKKLFAEKLVPNDPTANAERFAQYLDNVMFAGAFHDAGYAAAILSNGYKPVSSLENEDNGETTQKLKFSVDHEEQSYCKYLQAVKALPKHLHDKVATAKNLIVAGYCIFHTKFGMDATFDDLLAKLLTNPTSYLTELAVSRGSTVADRFKCPELLDDGGLYKKVIAGSPEQAAYSKWHTAKSTSALKMEDPVEADDDANFKIELKVAGSACGAADFYAYTEAKGVCRSADCGKEFRQYSGVYRNTNFPGAQQPTAHESIEELLSFWAGQVFFIGKIVPKAGSFKDYQPLVEAPTKPGLHAIVKLQGQVHKCLLSLAGHPDNSTAREHYESCLGSKNLKLTADFAHDGVIGCVPDTSRSIPAGRKNNPDGVWKDSWMLASEHPHEEAAPDDDVFVQTNARMLRSNPKA